MNFFKNFTDGLDYILDNLSPKKPVKPKGLFTKYKQALASDRKKIEQDFNKELEEVKNEYQKK